MKKYSQEEVEILLREQREISILAISVQSMPLHYPRDFDKIADIIRKSPLVNIDHNLEILNAQDKSRSVTLQEESKEECDHKYQEVNWGDISYNKCYSCGKIKDKHSG